MITRRNFIEMLSLTVVGGASLTFAGKALGQTFKPGDLFSLPAESLSDPVLSFTSAHFTPFINNDFQGRPQGARRSERLKLLNVKEVQLKGNLEKSVAGDSFSLMFASLRNAPLTGNLFEFVHPSLGVFTLFLTPVSAEPNRYEAIINHHRLA
ncbi:MAG TPA: hypothetical protein VGC76_00575 [Pyrinomonadaceae bacterium]|jgi:hypothetical protein